jgi:murein L,D-transpeptidase YafK
MGQSLGGLRFIGLIWMLVILPLSSLQLVSADKDDDPRAGLLPEALVSLGEQGSTAVVVSKSDSRLEIYRQLESGKISRVATYRTSTGRGIGDKLVEGDLKTPEGIYYFVRIREDQDLPSKYGIRAFDLNYPNRLDQIDRKTGYGIWLHGTDEPERLDEPRTSEGCVVLSNEDVSEISDYLTLYRTPIIIGENIAYTDLQVIEKDRNSVRSFLADWLRAWSHQDSEAYVGCYSENFRGSKARKKAWANRKQRVFENTQWAEIQISDLKILRDREHLVVTFFQHYASNLMDDTGIKWLYLREEDEGIYSIISEEWHPVSKIRKGKDWHQKSVKLTSLVEEIAGVELNQAGKLVVKNPEFVSSNKTEWFALQKEKQEKAKADKQRREISALNSPVVVENVILQSSSVRNIELQFDVTNKQDQGTRRRGWVYLIANWDNGKRFTSFPEGVTGQVPQNPTEGDSYGIRWYKTVEATLKRPAADAELTEIQAFVYNERGEQIGGYQVNLQPGEVR